MFRSVLWLPSLSSYDMEIHIPIYIHTHGDIHTYDGDIHTHIYVINVRLTLPPKISIKLEYKNGYLKAMKKIIQTRQLCVFLLITIMRAQSKTQKNQAESISFASTRELFSLIITGRKKSEFRVCQRRQIAQMVVDVLGMRANWK